MSHLLLFPALLVVFLGACILRIFTNRQSM